MVREGGQKSKGHGVPGYRKDADFYSCLQDAGTRTSHSTHLSWPRVHRWGNYSALTHLTPWRGGWIPFFTFSLSTLATEVVRVGGGRSRVT